MKLHTTLIHAPSGCMAFALATGLAVATAQKAAAQALQAQLVVRSLSPQDIKDHSLTGAQVASGLTTVGVGQPAHLEAWVNIAVAPSNIVSVTWHLTSKPPGSATALATSPLGAHVPIDKPSERLRYQIAGRTFLRPDVTGQYTVSATITTASSGTTNLTQIITAGTYLGVNTCALCHSGGVVAPDIYHPWLETGHASKFAREIDGGTDPATSHYNVNCVKCHTVGYDTDTNAVNGGFDDIAAQVGWTFPTNLAPGNWASIQANYPKLANVANIQCENCHGPGSEHAFSLGNTNRISKTFNAGMCGQCHDSLNSHWRNTEWESSGHAVSPRIEGANRAACMRCHNAQGFKNYANGTPAVGLAYEAIGCATCHDPHDATNPHQLRLGTTFTFEDGTTITNAGKGGFCMNCHHARNGSAAHNIPNYQAGLPTWAGGSSFGVHASPQADLLLGINAVTYGKEIPSAAHRHAVEDTCVGCHMQPVARTHPAFTKAGGHTWKMHYDMESGGVTNTVDLVDVCVKCHGSIDSFDMVKVDYNGDGVIEGVQTEVQHLLDRLSTLLPPRNSPNVPSANPASYVADGKVKTQFATYTNVPIRFLRAAYNWQFVNADGSKGVHNAPYAVGILKASIADLTGDANEDGLPDTWQVQYFGSATDPDAAPNATPANDGMPNWLKYALSLDPRVAGTVVPDGVVFASGKKIGGQSDKLHIYTAAEIAFDTEVGKSYQIQAVSALGGGWQNIGTPIPGTGNAISYVTPTRQNVQQYYRVVIQ